MTFHCVYFYGSTCCYLWRRAARRFRLVSGLPRWMRGADSKLLADLKALRKRLAEKEKVPAFVIFSNATLEDMAKKQPKTMDEFLTVSGIGRVKAQRYGTAFLKELEKHRP